MDGEWTFIGFTEPERNSKKELLKIVADVIAQLLYRIDPHMDPGYLIGLSCSFSMT